MRRKGVLAGLGMGLCLVVAGCAAPLPKLDSPLPAQWQHASASNAAKLTDLHGWWRTFADPALDALVDRALAGNLDLAQARERLLAVRALQRRSHARYLPGLNARTRDAIDPDASGSYFVAGFDASWELGLFGRAEGTRRQAQASLDAGVADWRATQVSLVSEVAREWIGLRTAQQQEQLLQKISQTRHHAWQLLQVRQRLQLASTETTDQAQAAAAQADAALTAPRQAITASAQRLAILLGQNHPDPAWLQPGAPPELGAFQLLGTPAELLRTRPEIARAEAEVLRAAGEQALAHADLYPSIALGSSMVWATDINNNHRYSTTPNAIFSLGPVIDMPLFDWGMRVAAKHAKDHELQASVLAYRQAVLQGVAEVETALGDLQQQHRREQHSQQAWQALQRVDQSALARVKLQLASPLERTQSQLAATQAAIDLSDARAAHSLAFVALFKALGGAPLPDMGKTKAAASMPQRSAAGTAR
ncbi:MAG: TolC family protein [Rhodanobacter sp.]